MVSGAWPFLMRLIMRLMSLRESLDSDTRGRKGKGKDYAGREKHSTLIGSYLNRESKGRQRGESEQIDARRRRKRYSRIEQREGEGGGQRGTVPGKWRSLDIARAPKVNCTAPTTSQMHT